MAVIPMLNCPYSSLSLHLKKKKKKKKKESS